MTDHCATSDLLPFEQALTTMLLSINPIAEYEQVALTAALDRVLATDIISPVNVPPYNNSAMDGYAFSHCESKSVSANSSGTFKLVGRSLAGSPFSGKCAAGQCIRIMTGARLPDDCDTVVMQENCIIEDDDVQIEQVVVKGNNVRFIGEDIAIGQEVFNQGRQLSSADIGILASLGIAKVKVYRRLNVAIFSTGDELKLPSESLASGDIYESNSHFIANILRRLNINVINLGIIADDKEAIAQAFIKADEVADAVISSGGVSVGDADYTKEVLAQLGDIGFWKIAMKPGKPFAFGKLKSSLFFGLPGNPVSALVTAHQLVIPALLRLQNAEIEKTVMLKVKSSANLRKSKGRMDFQRGILTTNKLGELEVCSTGSQGSGVLTSIATANCYIVLPTEQGHVSIGEYVNVQLFDKYLQ